MSSDTTSTINESSHTVTGLPSVLDYRDYRAYLSDFYLAKKSIRKTFSLRAFGRLIGKNNAAYIARVMAGTRKLSDELVEPVCRVCGLVGVEKDYFQALVGLNHATTSQQSEYFSQLIQSLRPSQKFQEMTSQQWTVFSQWFIPLLLESVNLSNFKNDPEWISKRFRGLMTPLDVRLGIERLTKMGLLLEKDGKLQASSTFLVKRSDIPSSVINEFHAQMAARSLRLLPVTPMERREVSSTTVSIHHDDLAKLKRKIQQFRKEVMEEFGSPLAGADTTIQLNIQMMPMTQGEEE